MNTQAPYRMTRKERARHLLTAEQYRGRAKDERAFAKNRNQTSESAIIHLENAYSYERIADAIDEFDSSAQNGGES